MPTPLERSCALCVRRPRSLGGNESCYLISRGHDHYTKNGHPILESVELAFSGLRVQRPQGCSNFKAGDLRIKQQEVQQEGLF